MQRYLLIIVLIHVFTAWLGLNVFAQTEYNMQNAFVTDCEGILTDSNEGPEEGQYNHNENLTFTICVEGADEIIVAFEFFATEENYDILSIYDGPDTNAPLIAAISGALQPAPTFIATSGCVTFHFVSDENIVAVGWSANWSVEVNEPPVPQLQIDSDVECPMASASFSFDIPVPCDILTVDNFSVLGPGGSSVTGINILDCDPETNMAQQFDLTFEPPLSNAANYRIFFNASIQDACDNWHDISTNLLITLSNCPISVWVDLVDGRACEGECARLEASVSGGSQSGNYQFNWSHTPENSAIVEICADEETTVSVEVIDIEGSQTAEAFYTYIPLENPVILNPIQDTSCASRGDYFYNVSEWGGEFYSDIIPDNQRTSGRYQFWRWSNGDPVNTDVVYYIAPNGCVATDTVVVLPINAGSRQAACLDTDAFQVNGGSPVGGFWTGSHVSNDGFFDPVETGDFWIVYNAPNGCTAGKMIEVGDGVNMPDIDTICTSQSIDLEADPYGGRWSGPGITNNLRGRLEAWRAPSNQWNTYVYELNGCSESMDIYNAEIWAGPDQTLCLSEDLLTLPFEGNWSGPGTYLEDLNAFDISGLGVGEYNYTYRINTCSDRFELRIRETKIEASETPFFCESEEWVNLSDLVSLNPGGGTVTGPGIYYQNDQWYINPNEAGAGSHFIYYDNLNCLDSIEINVEGYASSEGFSFCERSSATTLQANPANGTWSGEGFLDTDIGLFDPQLLPVGNYTVTYHSPSGCSTDFPLDIFVFEEANIAGFDQQYCNRDTTYMLNLNPTGGIFTINGIETQPEINPSLLGAGTHELLYRRGTGECASSMRRFITVFEPISAVNELLPDSICLGESAVIEILATGGRGSLEYQWDGGLGFGNSQIARPQQSTTYRVVVDDQCSDPLMDSIYIHVYQPFDTDIAYGNPVCFEDTTYAELGLSPNDYLIEWQVNPPIEGIRIDGRPGVYTANVTALESGCEQEFFVQLPGAAPLKANFSLIPNQDCIDIINNEVEIIDLSIGYSSGTIDFGDGQLLDMTSSSSLNHFYTDTGDFTITLLIANDLGCADSMSIDICVENRVRLFVPNAFSPNEDGVNDEFEIFGIGIEDVKWQVYDRYGSLLYRGDGLETTWDGTHRGKLLNPGTYIVVVEYMDQITSRREVYTGEINLLR